MLLSLVVVHSLVHLSVRSLAQQALRAFVKLDLVPIYVEPPLLAYHVGNAAVVLYLFLFGSVALVLRVHLKPVFHDKLLGANSTFSALCLGCFRFICPLAYRASTIATWGRAYRRDAASLLGALSKHDKKLQ